MAKAPSAGPHQPEPGPAGGFGAVDLAEERVRLPRRNFIPRPERPGNIMEWIVPEIRRGTAWCLDDDDLLGPVRVSSAEAARTLGHQHSRGKRIDAGGLKQLRSKMRPGTRRENHE